MAGDKGRGRVVRLGRSEQQVHLERKPFGRIRLHHRRSEGRQSTLGAGRSVGGQRGCDGRIDALSSCSGWLQQRSSSYVAGSFFQGSALNRKRGEVSKGGIVHYH